jgi:hypothetical protein
MNHVHKSIAFRLLSKTISKSDDFQSRFRSNMTGTTCEAGVLTSLEHPNEWLSKVGTCMHEDRDFYFFFTPKLSTAWLDPQYLDV